MDPVLRKRVDALNDLFVEAREEIEMAEESKETTYYDEEAEIAQEAVEVGAVAIFWDVSTRRRGRGASRRGTRRPVPAHPALHNPTSTQAALAEYEDILGGLEEPEKGEFQRSNGLKMEQLKAELEILLHSDDH